MTKYYKAGNGRIIMRGAGGRFRKTNLQDLGVVKSDLQEGRAICANCGHGKTEWWHPIMKTGYCPKCNSQEKLPYVEEVQDNETEK